MDLLYERNRTMKQLLYIDLFCGAGGTSTGINSARLNGEQCAEVIACVNHDANAIASHSSNHPDALHFTEDIRTLELSPLVSHLQKCRAENPDALTVLWASLECTNFSRAKGGQSRDADSRTLAEHLFRYIEAIEPDYIQIENVEEFMSWGEVDENGKPISMDKGKSYLRWVRNVKRYGYNFEHRILNAADYGAYTSRKRFFGIFARKGLPIVFPEPTHCKNGSKNLFSELQPWKPVRDVLDFSNEGESIFDRKKPLSEKTLERIHAGLIKFVAGGKDLRVNYEDKDNPYIPIETLEGTMKASVGDYIIKGVKGEIYPCKPDIFEAIYDCAGTPLDRMHREIDELVERFNKLDAFMKTDKFLALPPDVVGLLEIQYGAMMAYNHALQLRAAKMKETENP